MRLFEPSAGVFAHMALTRPQSLDWFLSIVPRWYGCWPSLHPGVVDV